jgi:hypothetical protein
MKPDDPPFIADERAAARQLLRSEGPVKLGGKLLASLVVLLLFGGPGVYLAIHARSLAENPLADTSLLGLISAACLLATLGLGFVIWRR